MTEPPARQFVVAAQVLGGLILLAAVALGLRGQSLSDEGWLSGFLMAATTPATLGLIILAVAERLLPGAAEQRRSLVLGAAAVSLLAFLICTIEIIDNSGQEPGWRLVLALTSLAPVGLSAILALTAGASPDGRLLGRPSPAAQALALILIVGAVAVAVHRVESVPAEVPDRGWVVLVSSLAPALMALVLFAAASPDRRSPARLPFDVVLGIAAMLGIMASFALGNRYAQDVWWFLAYALLPALLAILVLGVTIGRQLRSLGLWAGAGLAATLLLGYATLAEQVPAIVITATANFGSQRVIVPAGSAFWAALAATVVPLAIGGLALLICLTNEREARAAQSEDAVGTGEPA